MKRNLENHEMTEDFDVRNTDLDKKQDKIGMKESDDEGEPAILLNEPN